jgi:hypothetical protein
MCVKYEICSCDEALALLHAIEKAWAEMPVSKAGADKILGEALDHHHENVKKEGWR